jgi:hypothetical protein
MTARRIGRLDAGAGDAEGRQTDSVRQGAIRVFLRGMCRPAERMMPIADLIGLRAVGLPGE